MLKVEMKCPHCGEAIEIEREEKRRGVLAGLTVDQMTDEQLKREIINAKSVLYKAEKRNADANTILANQARVDAAMEEKEKRAPVVEEAPAEEVPAAEEAPKKEKKEKK